MPVRGHRVSTSISRKGQLPERQVFRQMEVLAFTKRSLSVHPECHRLT
jgi:hypothetical protein